jgi:hypothetical protein
MIKQSLTRENKVELLYVVVVLFSNSNLNSILEKKQKISNTLNLCAPVMRSAVFVSKFDKTQRPLSVGISFVGTVFTSLAKQR